MNISVRKAFILSSTRILFNIFGMTIAWSVISMGLDILCGKLNLSIPRDYLYFMNGYTPRTYHKLLIITQEMYVFELILSVTGITSQSFITSLMQIGSRVFISRCACTNNNLIITGIMMIVWGVSDLIRFLYYTCPMLKKPRYLASLILYPIGIFCEVFLMVYMRSTLTLIGLITYIPGFVYLYGRIRQKKKSVDRLSG
ncbi:very-long-chain (3R)-3-hydroxyacyl-CoA dehydratase [Nematocida sp. AWRm78]|nr:very-long-chain (3R)-3-hydroxyacyl-CoA dehydratase [Nematocida sp. AWRm79]KAI5184856.1 very-long-chain (3R)-3-hydroxyacyl-CoA dehydratase [Nematocida sp. AWRm78]